MFVLKKNVAKKTVSVQRIKRSRGKIAGTSQLIMTIPVRVARKAKIGKGSKLVIGANGKLSLKKSGKKKK